MRKKTDTKLCTCDAYPIEHHVDWCVVASPSIVWAHFERVIVPRWAAEFA